MPFWERFGFGLGHFITYLLTNIEGMEDERPIFRMYVENIGWVNRYSQVKRLNKSPDETTWIDVDKPIEELTVTAEIAPITWYKQKDGMEYNGKYVVAIERFTPIK